MAVTIISESYGPRKPFVVCTAASTDELADYAGLWAEGSEATISATKYILDRTKGWVEEGGGGGSAPFIVNLTPTAEDFSGTMDKTVAEINAAYEAGQKIVFKVMESETSYMMVDCSAQYFDGHDYPSFNAYIVNYVGIVFAATGTRDDGTYNEYGTTIYPLTPMS